MSNLQWFKDEYAARWNPLKGESAWAKFIDGDGKYNTGANREALESALEALERRDYKFGPKLGTMRKAYKDALKRSVWQSGPPDTPCARCDNVGVRFILIGKMTQDGKNIQLSECIKLPFLYCSAIPCLCSVGARVNLSHGPISSGERQPFYTDAQIRTMNEVTNYRTPGEVTVFMEKCKAEGREPRVPMDERTADAEAFINNGRGQ